MTPDLAAGARRGHNGGPRLDALTLAEAQDLDNVERRPSYVQRYCGSGSPRRAIVGIAGLDAFGRRVLLDCGHYRVIRDFDLMPALGRKPPTAARCGCCRLGYLAEPADLATVERLTRSA